MSFTRTDKDVGDATLAGFLLEVILKLSTVLPFVELEDDRFDARVFCRKKCFGPFAIWAPTLGEHNNGVSGYGVIDDFFGGRHQIRFLIDIDGGRPTM